MSVLDTNAVRDHFRQENPGHKISHEELLTNCQTRQTSLLEITKRQDVKAARSA